MKKTSLDLQAIVAVVFTLLFLLFAFTILSGQDTGKADKKERTKIVTLKIVEDENGVVKQIDTTFVMDADPPLDFPDSFRYWTGDDATWLDMKSLDSVFCFDMKKLPLDIDSLEKHMFFLQEDMDRLREEMEGEYDKARLHYYIRSDSLMKDSYDYFFKYDDAFRDSVIQKEFDIQHFHSPKHKCVIIGSNGDTNNAMKRKVKIVRAGVDEDGFNTYDIDGDTIIVSGGTTYVVTTTDTAANGETIKTVTVTSGGPEGKGEEKTITVVIDDDGATTWSTVEGDNHVIVKSDCIVIRPGDADPKELKEAGIDKKSKDLDVENLSFAPNPSNGKFNLSFTLKEKKKVTINIYDQKGNIVYTETLKDFDGTYSKEIDISESGEGVFFLQILQGIYDIIKKIIIR